MAVPGLRWCWTELKFRGGWWGWENFCECSAKIFWGFWRSLVRSAVCFRTNWFWSVFLDLNILPLVPLSIESVSPKRTLIGVCLMVTAAIRALEWTGTGFAFLGFQPWRVHLGISFATPSKFAMMFGFVWSIAFNTFGALNSAWKGCVSPLPTIIALGDAGVHVGSLDGRNVVPDVETSVD